MKVCTINLAFLGTKSGTLLCGDPSSNILIFGTVYSEIFASTPLVFSASLKNDERNEFVLRG